MKYSGQRKLLCEISRLSKLNAFNLLGYWTNTNASIIVYKVRPEGTGFNTYARTECTWPQLTFLALVPWIWPCTHDIYWDKREYMVVISSEARLLKLLAQLKTLSDQGGIIYPYLRIYAAVIMKGNNWIKLSQNLTLAKIEKHWYLHHCCSDSGYCR